MILPQAKSNLIPCVVWMTPFGPEAWDMHERKRISHSDADAKYDTQFEDARSQAYLTARKYGCIPFCELKRSDEGTLFTVISNPRATWCDRLKNEDFAKEFEKWSWAGGDPLAAMIYTTCDGRVGEARLRLVALRLLFACAASPNLANLVARIVKPLASQSQYRPKRPQLKPRDPQ